MYKAVGIHVFAGGFTAGVMKHPSFEVQGQLETFDLGQQTVEQQLGLPFIRNPQANWPRMEGVSFAFGNPRCTAFSCMTSNCDETGHGAFAKQTIDIVQFSDYCAANDIPVAAWESVQQAYTTGRPLLDHICEQYWYPRDYRVAHLLLNAASFGNAQRRKRYFFVAYKRGLRFNIVPPDIDAYYKVVYDAIGDLDPGRPTRPIREKGGDDYDEDCYIRVGEDMQRAIEVLPNGMGLNQLAKHDVGRLPDSLQLQWNLRSSELPFSLHCPFRLGWFRPSPTLSSSSRMLVHPEAHRPVTVGELARIMGWDYIPRGPMPVGQIAKGIVPAIGTWLAEQVRRCLDGEWGDDDYESTYDPNLGEWVGENTHDRRDKTFNLTKYFGQLFDIRRYPATVPTMPHPYGEHATTRALTPRGPRHKLEKGDLR